MCLIYPLVAIAITSGRVMQGLGKGIPVLVITTIRVIGISAPLALYFSFVLNKPVEWNWYAIGYPGIAQFHCFPKGFQYNWHATESLHSITASLHFIVFLRVFNGIEMQLAFLGSPHFVAFL